jgi:Xaa-Pro aminopeptidase
MVISIEAEYRHPEVGHVKLEDTVVVTSTAGARGWATSAGNGVTVERRPGVA